MLTDTQFKVAPVLATWQEAFEAWLRLDGRKSSLKPLRENSVLACLQDVRQYSRFHEQMTGAEFTPDRMTVQIIRIYWEAQANAAPASANRRLASLRTLVRWATSVGLLDQDPTARLPLKEMTKLPPRAKDEVECRSLAKAVKAGKHLKRGTPRYRTLGLRDQIIWGLLYDAGLRRAEVAGLRVRDVYLGEKPYLQITGKGGKIRQVAIKQKLARTLAAWLKVRPGADDGTLVTAWSGKGISPCQVWRRFELVCAAAGVKGTPHDLRHTFVYRTVEEALKHGATRAVALAIARDQAGHSDSRITELYLRPTSDFIYQVVEGM